MTASGETASGAASNGASGRDLSGFECLPFATNSHIHLPPNFSAFQRPDEPLPMAVSEGIGLIGLSNYYDYRVYETFTEEANRHGIFVLLGTEIIALDEGLKKDTIKVNDPGNPGKMYICGKAMAGLDAMSPVGRRLLARIREADARRMEAMTEKLRGALLAKGFATDLTAEQIRAKVAAAAGVAEDVVVLQERHLAMAFQRTIWGGLKTQDARMQTARRLLGDSATTNAEDEVALQNELRSAFMKAGRVAFVEEEFVSVEEAQALVLAAAGIPCYPVLADGTEPITEFERGPSTLATRLKAMGFHAVEFIPNRNTPEVLREYVMVLREAGLIVLAGTEHNTTEKIALTPTCAGGAAIPADVRRIFDEGICVAAAHQGLGMSFIEEDGTLPVGADELEAHICRLARAGRELLLETRHGAIQGAAR